MAEENATLENLSGSGDLNKVEIEPPKVDAPEAPEVKEPESRTFTQKDMDEQIAKRVAREQRTYEKQLREERETRIRLEERLAANQPRQEPAKDGAPKLADYTDFDEYLTAKAEWIADRSYEKKAGTRQAEEKAQQAKVVQAQQAQAWEKKIAVAEKDLPDYKEIVSGSTAPLTDAMRAAIMESESGPQLAYYLATHPDKAAEIASQTPIQAVRALTLIEAGFKTNPVSKTPEPITPTGSRQTSGVKTLADSGSTEEFWKRRRAYIAQHRR